MRIWVYISIIFAFPATAQKAEGIFLEHVKAGYRVDLFDQLSNWNGGHVELQFKRDSLILIPRVTLANRFERTGVFSELEVYKLFRNGDYLSLDFGFSPDVIFPNFKAGIEYYNPFSTWEHSVGVRLLRFDGVGNVGVLTASLSKYHGSFLSILRGNLAYSEQSAQFTNFGGLFQERYYLSDVSYVGLYAAYGYDPSILILSQNEGISTGKNPYQYTIGGLYQSRYFKRFAFTLSYEYTGYEFVNFRRSQHTISIVVTLVTRQK